MIKLLLHVYTQVSFFFFFVAIDSLEIEKF